MKRQSLFPRVYSVKDAAASLRKPFKPPSSNGYTENKDQLSRRLWARKRFVPWDSSRPALVTITNTFNISNTMEQEESEEEICLPPGIEPLILWQSEEPEGRDCESVSIVVDPLLVTFLRPHQRYHWSLLNNHVRYKTRR